MLSDRSRQDQILDHEYDGIREYDNPTPGWWNWLFAVSVIFSILYWGAFHVGSRTRTIEENWELRQVAEFQKIFGALGTLEPDLPTIERMMADPQMMAVARGIFQGNCAACHARDGGGLIGPNLTDDVYKNVRSLDDFYAVITKGASNGAMPAWENRMSINERIILAAYSATLRGTTPALNKAPEGDIKPPPWPKATVPSKASANAHGDS